MLMRPLNRLVKATIEAGLAQAAITGVTVQQSNQPTKQGIPKGPMVAFARIHNKRYGWMKREDVWVPATDEAEGYMAHRTVQKMETIMQVTTLSTLNPKDELALTASDIAEAVAYSLQSDAGLALLRAQGVGILRVTDIREPAFLDDYDNSEYAPSFDFTLTHENVRLSTNPVVTSFELRMERL